MPLQVGFEHPTPIYHILKILLIKSTPETLSFINYVGLDEWHAGNLSYHLKLRPIVVFGDNNLHNYPHILLVYDSHRACPKIVWQLREHKFIINKNKYMICY